MEEKKVGVMIPSENVRRRAAEVAAQMLREGVTSSKFNLFNGDSEQETGVIATSEEEIPIPLGIIEIEGHRYYYGFPKKDA